MNDSTSDTSPAELEAVLSAASNAASILRWSQPRLRARGLTYIADDLEASRDELVAIAGAETGLTAGRLNGEISRTTFQLRLFGRVIEETDFCDTRIDREDHAYPPAPRPDVRRMLVSVGPVLNFAASNFPFAFSVAGGDTASAIAAGSPVIVKAHPGHPHLSSRVFDIALGALARAGLPEGTLGIIYGQNQGVDALKDPRVKAGTFTGSTHVGIMLAEVAAQRPTPIPFFGELGSLNPVVITADALQEDLTGLASGLAASVAGSAGQLCTKPGVVFVPENELFLGAVAEELRRIPAQRLLTESLARGYATGLSNIMSQPFVTSLVDGVEEHEEGTPLSATPSLAAVSIDDLQNHHAILLNEVFGPFTLLVTYSDLSTVVTEYPVLFPGNLTSTLRISSSEREADSLNETLDDLAKVMAETSGRILFDGWPTGVSVTGAMQHGGPWPATTNDSSTSVGTASIQRFLRPVAYQSAPHVLLPEALRG